MRTETRSKRVNWIIAAVATLIYAITVSKMYDYFYYINDDFIISDILSGRYSGVPDAHVYNVIYPFALVLKWCYQIFPGVDFWGLLMVGLLYVCMFAVLYRVLNLIKKCIPVAILCVYLGFSCVALFAVCFFTFTLTGAICAATALFLFVTNGTSDWQLRRYLPSLMLLLASFCIRKDTFLMVLPFFGLWALYLLIVSQQRKHMLHSVLRPVIALAVCCGILWGMHILAFSTDEWQDFLEFRDLRKAVHDYSGYPAYDGAPSLYADIGISREEYMVVGTTGVGGVNTVLDFSSDIRTILGKVGQWGAQRRAARSVEDNLNQAKRIIEQNLSNQPAIQGTMFLCAVITLCFGVIFLIRKYYFQLLFLLLGVVLGVLELIALGYKGRLTFAVTAAEVAVALIWVISVACFGCLESENQREHGDWLWIPLCVCILAGFVSAGKWIEKNNANFTSYSARSSSTEAIRKYCVAHPENAYFQPAFSISSHSYKLDAAFDNSFNNLVILGGWNATSPEYMQSLKSLELEYESIEQAILNQENVYIVSPESNVVNIIAYFQWKYAERLTFQIVDEIPGFDTTHVYDFTLLPKN